MMEDPNEEPFETLPGYRSNAAQNLRLEAQLHPNEGPLERAKRLLREAADSAASSIIEIALHGSTEKLRLDASKLILDRAIGPVNLVQADDTDSPLNSLIRDLEQAANGG